MDPFPLKHLFYSGPLHRLTILGFLCATLAKKKTGQWETALMIAANGESILQKEIVQLLDAGFQLAGHSEANVGDIFARSHALPLAQIALRRASVPKLHLSGLAQVPEPSVVGKPILKDSTYQDSTSNEFEPENYEIDNLMMDVEEPYHYEDTFHYRRGRTWKKYRSYIAWLTCNRDENTSIWGAHDRARAATCLLSLLLFFGCMLLYVVGSFRQRGNNLTLGIFEFFLFGTGVASLCFALFLSASTSNAEPKEDKYAKYAEVIRRHQTAHRTKVDFDEDV